MSATAEPSPSVCAASDPAPGSLRLRARVWRITAGYALFAIAWIYFSDRAIALLAPDPEVLLEISTYKGLAFVMLTTLMLFLLMRQSFGAIDKGYRAMRAQATEIRRLNQLYAALSQINQAIVMSPARDELFHTICRVLVDHGGFRLAWVGWHDRDTHRLLPTAHYGDFSGHLQSTPIYVDERPEGLGPAGTACREGRTVVSNDFVNDPNARPWHEEAHRRGIRAVAAFPIRVRGEVMGALTVYAHEIGYFADPEIALLVEAASDISFALDRFADDAERRQIETRADDERRFSDMMIENLPGIVYFYDRKGGFLRWNRNFEVASGYAPDEIAAMHPLEFFSAHDRDMVGQRIDEVFADGLGSVEAELRSKDGELTPYYLTGHRVTYQGEPCLAGVGIDMSERDLARRALQASEHRYRTTLDNILEGCQLIGFDWRYLYLNDAAAVHNRRPNAELLGRTMQACWPGIEQTRIFTLTERSLRNRVAVQEEVEFTFADGSVAWFDMRVQPNDEGVLALSIDRTERKQAELLLAASERKYRELVENANSIILRWNAAGEITLLNEYGQRFFGFAQHEILGRHVLETIVPDVESSGRDLQRLMDAICADPKAFEHNVNENVRSDGQRVWISWTNRIVWDENGNVEEILSVGTDITAQVEAHEALRHSEEQFRLIMENLADLVAVVGLDGRRIYNSPSYQGILGNLDHLEGSSSFDQVHPDDRDRVQRTFDETVRTGRGHRLEYRLIDRLGDPRYIESQGSVIRDAQGEVAQVIVVSRDVTERREAEQAIRELNTNLERRVAERTGELQSALVRAEAADRIKSAFLATMSHELRTPLNSIIGFTGILLQGLAGPLNEEQSKQLGMVQGSARHLLELINDVLDISKIEAGQLEVRAETFDLATSIERVTALVQSAADKKGLALVRTLPAALPEIVSDRRRVEQILLNLLNNAIKFTDSGQVSLHVDTVAAFQADPQSPPCPGVRLRVADTGIGIKRDDLAILFQPFRQIDTGLSRQHEGTGLGLAICRRLVGLLGGTIAADSTWQQGSEFTVVLPVTRTIAP